MKLTEYLQKSREERTSHVDLNTPCNLDQKGRLKGKQALLSLLGLEDDVENWTQGKVHLCHLCDHHSKNGWCSNPLHLYVGTASENSLDVPEDVRKSSWAAALEARNREKDENGKSVNAVLAGKAGAEGRNREKDERGRSVNAVKGAEAANSKKDERGKSLAGVRGAAAGNAEKDERGRSANAVKGAVVTNTERDEQGRCLNPLKGAEATNAEKNEKGQSVNAVKGGVTTAAQRFVCLVTGRVLAPAPLTRYQKAKGVPTELRGRLGVEGSYTLLNGFLVS